MYADPFIVGIVEWKIKKGEFYKNKKKNSIPRRVVFMVVEKDLTENIRNKEHKMIIFYQANIINSVKIQKVQTFK